MKRWVNNGQHGYGESAAIDAFISEVIALCTKHGDEYDLSVFGMFYGPISEPKGSNNE